MKSSYNLITVLFVINDLWLVVIENIDWTESAKKLATVFIIDLHLYIINALILTITKKFSLYNDSVP